MNRKFSLIKPNLIAILVIVLFGANILAISTFAARPDMKMVDTVVGSYPMDGKTVYFVSHVTGIEKWIVEPTEYLEWPDGSGQSIPIDGEFWIKSSSFEGERRFTDDSHVSIMSIGTSFEGTFEIVATSPEFPWLPPYMPMPKNVMMNTYTIMKNYGELGTSKYHTIVKYVDSVPHVLMEKTLSPPQPSGKIAALLTGVIDDYGLDEDGDSLNEYLVVSVEIRVKAPGFYNLIVFGLQDFSGNWINVYNSTYMYLDRGTQLVDVLLDGNEIYFSGFNPSIVPNIELYDETFNMLGSMSAVPLSREYSFEEFTRPSASLTGVVYEEGVDTDGDGTINYLEVDVEVNVLKADYYIVYVLGLSDAIYNYIDVWDSEFQYFNVGTRNVILHLNGPVIYSSGVSPSLISSILLYDDHYNILDYRNDVPLSKEYSNAEFDAPGAYLTGTITDQGVDTDSDGTFDYLEIGVQVEVNQAGTYVATADGLLTEEGTPIYVYGFGSTYLDLGTQCVYLHLDGPLINMQGLSPSRVSILTLYDENYYLNYNDLGRISDIPLSRTYLSIEFDGSP